MSEKYGVFTPEKSDENVVEELAKHGARGKTTECPQCGAVVELTPTLTRKCPNCGTQPFEG